MDNAGGTSLFILVADDDPVMLELLRDAFLTIDYSVKLYMVDNGLEAIRYLDAAPKEELPDIILLDHNMPFLTGDEVLQKIASEKRCTLIPKIILSSNASPEIRQKCLDAGATKYLLKPYGFLALLNIAEEIIGTANKRST